MARVGTQTVAKICGSRWSRLMPLTWAAAYCGMNLARFRSVPELESLIHDAAGEKVVDKNDLDAWIDRNKEMQNHAV